MTSIWRAFLCIFLQLVVAPVSQTTECSISLPQNAKESCRVARGTELKKIQRTYALVPVSPQLPIMCTNFTKETFYQKMTDSVNKQWAYFYKNMAKTSREMAKEFGQAMLQSQTKTKPRTKTDVSTFEKIYHLFLTEFKKVNPFIKYPFEHEQFRDVTQIWESDKFFAEQRLAGLNPVSITRVTEKELEVSEMEVIGCYRDRAKKNHRALRHLYLNMREQIDWTNDFPDMSKVINACAKAAEENGYKIFGIQFWGECFGDTNAENRYYKYGESKFCEHGVGKHFANQVYRLKSRVGVPWSKLQTRLNPTFDWEKAVQSVLGSESSLEKALRDGLVFVLHHTSREGLPTSHKDRIEPPTSDRKMRSSKSPIGLFVSRLGETDKQTTLEPVAIQLDSYKDSAVFTPGDGGRWIMAKEEMQLADLAHVQLVEHLVQTHLMVEPLCTTLQRHLHQTHPLYQVLQWHCRGVHGTNFMGFKVLVGQGGAMDTLFSMGHDGTMAMIGRGYLNTRWEELNFYEDLKIRGVEDKKVLPYYPYRDDGKVIMDTINQFVTEYINIHYESDEDVINDIELQHFANEVSAEGEKHGGGIARIRGFPPEFRKKELLVRAVSQFIWMSSAAHSAVGYPVSVYGSFTPNMPTKLYDDPTAPENFSIKNLPSGFGSLVQVNLTMVLGSMHFDQLLDYSDKLQDKSQEVTQKYFNVLSSTVTGTLKERNQQRYEDGHLTYPFLLPEYIANSIHT